MRTHLTLLDLHRIKTALEALEADEAPADPLALGPPVVERAAVAAVLRETTHDHGAEVLLIERAAHPRDPWSGHMALPGGRMDPHDEDLCATATRETLEEIGLDLSRHATFVGPLPIVDTRSHGLDRALAIAPFVFVLSGEPAIQAGPEVADVLWAPVSELVSGSVDTSIRFERAGVELTLPGWRVQGRIVWGLTYRMLTTLFRAAGWLRT